MKRTTKMAWMLASAGFLAVLAVAAAVTIANPTPTAAQSTLTFGAQTIDDFNLTQMVWVDSEPFPAATGGSGDIKYSLSPKPYGGLRFQPATRTLTGRGTWPQAQRSYTYTATDSAGAKATLTSNITVTGISPLFDQIAAQDSLNPDDSSKYTNLLVSWKLAHRWVPPGKSVQSYQVEAAATSAGPWTDVTDDITDVETIERETSTYYLYRHAGLKPGDTRFYRITTTYNTGEETLAVTTYREVSTRALPTPAWPSNHKGWTYPGSADPDGSLEVWWKAPKNVPGNLMDHLTYTLQSKTGSNSWADVATGITGARYLHTGLDAETTVSYRVKATIGNTAAGWTATETGWSGEFTGTTQAAPLPEPPGAPSVTTSVTENSVTLTWEQVTYSDDNSEGSVLYTVRGLVESKTASWTDLATRNSALTYTHTGLSAEQTIYYTVQSFIKVKGKSEYVAGDVWNGEATTSAASEGEASGAGEASPSPGPGQSGESGTGDAEPPSVSFVIYHDPNAGGAAVNRYNQASSVLADAGISYAEVVGDVQDDVDRLAGVTNSILPRFFLGDPIDGDWVSEPGQNNGGLRWLKNKLAELSQD